MASRPAKKVKSFRSTVKITCLRSGRSRKIPKYSCSRADGLAGPSIRPVDSQSFEKNAPDDVRVSTASFDDGLSFASHLNGRNRYLEEKQREIEHWKKYRKEIEEAYIESCCLPFERTCSICHEKPSCENGAEKADTRCLDCGPNVFMCIDCSLQYHRKRNRFHSIEKWQDGTFVPLERPLIFIGLDSSHEKTSCSVSTRMIKVINFQGRQFDCVMEICTCKPDVFFFVKEQLWPSTPSLPRIAFDFKLMDLLESLFLESQVSVSSFCSSINNLVPNLWKLGVDRKDLLKALQGESFEEYRLFKHNIVTLRSICENRDNGAKCPACPSMKGTGCIIESIDACFGLVHKKSAGKYNFESKFGALKINDGEEVSKFMADYPKAGASSKDCNNFQAGAIGPKETIHSKGKSACYDIKGILGTICRHEFPCQFLDLKHGERIGYSVFLIRKKLEELKDNKDLTYCVLYDIACILRKHLQKNDLQLLEKIVIGLPAFHSYAHVPSCQALLGTRRVPKIGLSDGEQCERLWSYLRCFSSITKEMTKAHRNDTLTSALLYYGKKSIGKLCSALPKKMEKAINVENTCKEELNKLLAENTGMNGNIDVIQEWIEEERNELSRAHQEKSVFQESEHAMYVRKLLENRQIRQKLMAEDKVQDDKDIAADVGLLRRSEKELSKIEKTCGIRKRWTWSMDAAKQIAIDIVLEERKKLIETLRTLAHERKFLLKMKRLYANGQKLAKTLAISIGKKNKNINNVILPFNRKVIYLSKEIKELRGKDINVDKAKDPSSDMYSNLSIEDFDIPKDMKQEAIDLFCRLKRAEEEKELVKADMRNTICFFREERRKVYNASMVYNGDTLYERGAAALLKSDFLHLTYVLAAFENSFPFEVIGGITNDSGIKNIEDSSGSSELSDNDDLEDRVDMDARINTSYDEDIDFFEY